MPHCRKSGVSKIKHLESLEENGYSESSILIKHGSSIMIQNDTHLSRRDFIAATGAVALGAKSAIAQSDGRIINLGLIGCGKRGEWISDLFAKHGGYRLAAVADYFPDRTDAVGNKFGVAANRRLRHCRAIKNCWSVTRLMRQSLFHHLIFIRSRLGPRWMRASMYIWPNRLRWMFRDA